MSLYQAEGIVLANRDFGEADRIVKILCREQGKLEAVAKGARRPRNRFVGLTLPFNFLRLSLFSGRSLDELSQAEGIRSFQGLREDLVTLAYASYLCELTDETLPEHEPNETVFHLLLRALTVLDTGREHENPRRFYELRLMDLAGFRPAIVDCLACGRPSTQTKVTFAPADGGYYCPSCPRPGGELISISSLVLRALDQGLHGDEMFMAGLNEEDRRSTQRVLSSFINARLDREIRSLKFLNRILSELDGT